MIGAGVSTAVNQILSHWRCITESFTREQVAAMGTVMFTYSMVTPGRLVLMEPNTKSGPWLFTMDYFTPVKRERPREMATFMSLTERRGARVSTAQGQVQKD